jgi:hypothetical protein
VTGRSNIYRMAASGGDAVRVSDIATGVADHADEPGVVGRVRDRGWRTRVRGRRPDSLRRSERLEPAGGAGDPRDASAAHGPAHERRRQGARGEQVSLSPAAFQTGKADKFSLVGVGPSVGVSTGGAFGTYFSGGVSFLFSDILGNHLLATGISMNGSARFRRVGPA